ncbi:MAG: nitrogen fixation protein NifH [Dehalococcoidales bacterium]|nr:MAG: nitrogen fixation protein NifH [Dehalococcoidales bacterium]
MTENWKKQLNADPTDWLLEESDPGVRYLALRDIIEADEKEIKAARRKAHTIGLIDEILSKMNKEGSWVPLKPGPYPMNDGTVRVVVLLAQLGATQGADERIASACAYIFDHNFVKDGRFTETGRSSGNLDCLQGGLCCSLLDLGCTDPRLDVAFEMMARLVTGEGIAPATDRSAPIRYYSTNNCGASFACSGTRRESCAWGAVNVLIAFAKLPENRRTPLINRAIKIGIDFLLSKDPSKADYPVGFGTKPGGKPSRKWWKFGFPNFYIPDLIQNVEALTRLGYGRDPRLANAINFIYGKQDSQGRWNMEQSYEGTIWVDLGANNQPNKWVTLRALRVLKQAYTR